MYVWASVPRCDLAALRSWGGGGGAKRAAGYITRCSQVGQCRATPPVELPSTRKGGACPDMHPPPRADTAARPLMDARLMSIVHARGKNAPGLQPAITANEPWEGGGRGVRLKGAGAAGCGRGRCVWVKPGSVGQPYRKPGYGAAQMRRSHSAASPQSS